MGEIDIIGKWNLENEIWIENPNFKDYGRSFAIAKYERILNDDGKINYIIITQGSRVEDHSKDYTTIKEKEVKVNKFITHYKTKNKNYDIQLFLMDADAPIIEDAKLFAKYIEKLAIDPNTGTINIISLSKCCIMNFYVPSFFTRKESFEKTNLFNTAAPYEGTKMASPAIFYPEVKKVVLSKVQNETVANLIYKSLINIYEDISSNSHMDYDIAVINGVPDEKKNVYDENLIKNVFCSSNVEAIKKLKTFKNILTGIDADTLKKAIRECNFAGIGLCILDDVFFENKSDGMIYTSSQKIVEDILDIDSYRLKSTHHDVCGSKEALNDLLSIVDDTIDENNYALIKK